MTEKKPEQTEQRLKDFFTRGEAVEFFMDGVEKWVRGIVKYEMRPQRLYQVEHDGDLYLLPEHGLRRIPVE